MQFTAIFARYHIVAELLSHSFCHWIERVHRNPKIPLQLKRLLCVYSEYERGIESHPIIINIYTHVNLCASYQWFPHIRTCKGVNTHFILCVKSKLAWSTGKFQQTKSECETAGAWESGEAEEFIFKQHWLGKQYFCRVTTVFRCGFEICNRPRWQDSGVFAYVELCHAFLGKCGVYVSIDTFLKNQ